MCFPFEKFTIFATSIKRKKMQKDKYGTILVIDDNEAILTALRYCLSGTFQRIITKSSPDSVLTILNQEVVNLVLLDMMASSGFVLFANIIPNCPWCSSPPTPMSIWLFAD